MKARGRGGFTLLELVVMVAMFLVVVAMVLRAPRRMPMAPRERIKCVKNLRDVGLEFRIFAEDNNQLLPWRMTNRPPVTTYEEGLNWYKKYASISNEVGVPKFWTCPADRRVAATNWAGLTRAN